jgi:hypothetical protein
MMLSSPYSAAVELLTAERPELVDPKPLAPWIRPISDYERRETTLVEGTRYYERLEVTVPHCRRAKCA